MGWVSVGERSVSAGAACSSPPPPPWRAHALEHNVHSALIDDLLQAQPHQGGNLVAVVLVVIGGAVKGLVQAQHDKGGDAAVHCLEVCLQPLGLLHNQAHGVGLGREEDLTGH